MISVISDQSPTSRYHQRCWSGWWVKGKMAIQMWLTHLPAAQSAYHRYHSTETVLTKVVSDITMAADSGDVSVLALLDLSAAFDTIDHSILIQRLNISHHVKGMALCWFESYLHERYQVVTYTGITVPATMVAHVFHKDWFLDLTLYYVYRWHSVYCQ